MGDHKKHEKILSKDMTTFHGPQDYVIENP